jgi:hypothetical protein
LITLGLASACSSETAPILTGDAGGAGVEDAGPGGDAGGGDSGIDLRTDLRGRRYCEILLVQFMGTQVHIDVYTTYGLNSCPDAAWRAVDAARVAMETGATNAILNGPRYWMLDAFERGVVRDPTVRTLGGIEMRIGGAIDVPLASVGGLGRNPYTKTTIQRETRVRFDAGKKVYELIDTDGRGYAMQSYSVQRVAQTEASLDELPVGLTLPTGWTFRARTLTEPLFIESIDGAATLIQDDLGNSYQQVNP